MRLFLPQQDVAAENEAIAAILGIGTDVVTAKRSSLDAFDNAEGQKIWPASIAFAQMITGAGRQQVKDRDVIELGCGVGGVGIAAALAGARSVLLTDFQPKSLELAQAAAEANGVGDRVSTRLLDWKDPSWAGLDSFEPDLILASDVLYSRDLASSLLDIVAELLLRRPRDKRPEAKAMLVDPPNRPARGALPALCSARGLYWGGEAPVLEAEEPGTVLINILRA